MTEETPNTGIMALNCPSDALDPTACVPPEVMVVIFKECQSWQNTFRRTLWKSPWIAVTQVCPRWRAISLATPILWATVEFDHTSPEQLRAWLNRSGGTLLSLSIRSSEDSEIFGLIMEELPRTKELRLHHNPSFVASLQWPQTVTSLQHLVLSDISSQSVQTSYKRKRGVRRVRDAFSRSLYKRFPTLKMLTVTSCQYHWRRWILPETLTQLKIVNYDFAPETSSMHDIVHVLRHLPLLEELHLEDALPIGVHTFQDAKPVSLPLLNCLCLRGDAIEQMALLNLLMFPPSARLKLHLRGDDGLSETCDVASLASRISEVSPFKSVCITTAGGIWGSVTFRLTGWRDLQTMETIQTARSQWDVEPDLDLEVDVPDAENEGQNEDWAPILNLLTASPLSDTRILSLDYKIGPLFDVPEIYRTMREVHSLNFIGDVHAPHDCLRRLMNVLEAYPELFPKLRVFRAEGVDFEGPDLFSRFKEYFRGRRRGMACDISLDTCFNLSSADVGALAEVTTVRWDQKLPLYAPVSWDDGTFDDIVDV